jgi:TetR/AcrR family transcriptional repressor of mexJK operon
MGRKKQNPAESAKRSLILKQAGKMFMTLGFSAVSMDALAEAVPVSKRTLYNHFNDKKALFTAIMQSRCQLLFNQLQESLNEHQGIEKTLTAIAEQFLAVVFEPDAINIYRIAITEAQSFPEMGKLFYESGPKRSTMMLASYLEKTHKKGLLSIKNPELAANVFLSMLTNRMQMQCMLGLKKSTSKKEKKEIISYVVQVFLHGQTAV